MKITKVETIPLTMPYLPSDPDISSPSQSRGRFEEVSPKANFSIVKIYTDEDIIGVSETGLLAPKSEHLLIDDHLGPAILGMDPFNIEQINNRMRYIEMHLFERLGPLREAEAAIDIALHDIIGKTLNKPIYKLIGGKVRDTIPLEPLFSGGLQPVDEMVKLAKQGYDMGHRVVRIKVGRDLDMEVKRVKGIREALGDSVKLMIDANQAWTPKEAVKYINRIDKYDLYCVEQPVAHWDLKGMAFVRNNVRPLVMADESIGSPRDALNLIREEAADAFHIYLTKAPGISNAIKIATIAEPAGVLCFLGHSLSLSGIERIGRMAALHVAFTINNLMFGVQRRLFGVVEDLIAEPLKISDEGIKPPRKPGLGINLDWIKIEKYRRKSE
ncbi:MAG: mandelate racemase/muconate lactonizing enzyme family protein [Promethearchaeota archaeon]|jgi:L-alanine-DL-glutamate epimerase-like enolase superfamily enzyme